MSENQITLEKFYVKEPNHWKPWIIAIIASILIIGIALLLMWRIGLLEISQSDQSSKTLAAALGLVGTVLAASLTLVGTIVKYSIDDRNTRLAATEAMRNYVLALETEKRNRIEAAIRAVALLSENNKDTTENQIGGAILALVSLGELDLATALLSQIWPSGLASPHIADIVLSKAIMCNCADTQTAAAAILLENADRIKKPGFYFWPIPGPGWRTDLPGNCKIGLVLSAIHWLKAGLETNKDTLPDAALVLYQALDDPDDIIVDIAAASLRPIVRSFDDSSWVFSGESCISVKEIADRLERSKVLPATDRGVQIELEIKKILNLSD